jgi:hypothetical protein
VYAVEVDREAREFLQRTLQDYPEPGDTTKKNVVVFDFCKNVCEK